MGAHFFLARCNTSSYFAHVMTTHTANGHGKFAVQIVRLPRLFIDDHIERDCDTPEIIKTVGKCYVMRVDDPAMPELLNDAAYYGDESMSGPGGFDSYLAPIIRSARRLLAAYERQTGTALDKQGRVRAVIA